MQAHDKLKTILRTRCNSPSCEHTGQFTHVFLGITAMYAQCMKFHQFSGVVFIQTAAALPSPSCLRADTEPLVQVVKHGGMLGAGQYQVFKLTQGMGSGHIDGIVPCKRSHAALLLVHIEMVKPELCHSGEQRLFNIVVAATCQAPSNGFVHLSPVVKQGLCLFLKIETPFVGHQFIETRSRRDGSAGFSFTASTVKDQWEAVVNGR